MLRKDLIVTNISDHVIKIDRDIDLLYFKRLVKNLCRIGYFLTTRIPVPVMLSQNNVMFFTDHIPSEHK